MQFLFPLLTLPPSLPRHLLRVGLPGEPSPRGGQNPVKQSSRPLAN